jgi:hypothetical protein
VFPKGKQDYTPHEKSMHLGKLAAHTARLPEFATYMFELPHLDFGELNMRPLVMESRQQLLEEFDALVEKVRKLIAGAEDTFWQQNWKLSFKGQTIVESPRFQVYRDLFLNHLIHHRAQLGVYLRLNDIPLPAIYGPSADDRMGF